MNIISDIKSMQEQSAEIIKSNKTIGFVPTMGYFHEGHLSLMHNAKKENDYVVASIFVNPTQFAPNEDLDKYPQDVERDVKLAERTGVDILFTPNRETIYPQNYLTYVEVEKLSDVLCGYLRPTHFKGVATIVAKLFNIVKPTVAYFGQKDAQQAIIIKKMVEDLNFDIKIVTMPIIREADGLAMSSRNVYLNGRERKAAQILNKSLKFGRERFYSGGKDASVVKSEIEHFINTEPLAKIDYVAICDIDSLLDVEKIQEGNLISIAVKIGNTRLIDNVII